MSGWGFIKLGHQSSKPHPDISSKQPTDSPSIMIETTSVRSQDNVNYRPIKEGIDKAPEEATEEVESVDEIRL